MLNFGGCRQSLRVGGGGGSLKDVYLVYKNIKNEKKNSPRAQMTRIIVIWALFSLVGSRRRRGVGEVDGEEPNYPNRPSLGQGPLTYDES